MKILILDDNFERIVKFARNLPLITQFTHVTTAKDAIWQLSHKEFDVVFLDHDLTPVIMQESGPGTGWEVAKWLGDNPDQCPPRVVIHSLNYVGAEKMQELLPEAIYHPAVWGDKKALYYLFRQPGGVT